MMVYLNEEKVRYLRSVRGSLWRRLRRRKERRWLRRNEPFKRGVTNYRRTPPLIYTRGIRKVPIVAYGRMWGYEDKPILIKRRKLWVFLRKVGGTRRWETMYRYWIKQKRPRSNLLQLFMSNVVHFFAKPDGDLKKLRRLKRAAFLARQDFWYRSLRGARGAKHRIPVVDWPIFGFGWLDNVGLDGVGRKLFNDYSQQRLTESGREFLHFQTIPQMEVFFKYIRRGKMPFARYWLRAGSRLMRAQRDVIHGKWEPSELMIKEKLQRYVRRQTDEHFYDRPWYSRQTLIQFTENYPNCKPYYTALDMFPVRSHYFQTFLGAEWFQRYWDGTVRDHRPMPLAPFPSADLYPFDLDVTHNYGMDLLHGRSRLQKYHDRTFKRVSIRWLIGFVIEEMVMDYLEDDYSDQLWEDSEKMYCQDQDGEWVIDDDEGAGYDVDDEMECDLMYRHMVIGVAIRRFYKTGMKWMRLPSRSKTFVLTFQLTYWLYLLFLTSTFLLFLYLADSFLNITIFIIFALIVLFW